MGRIIQIACDNCNFNTQTKGFDEFYRDQDGNVKSYGHPKAINEEASKAGIKGFMGDVVCIDCGKAVKDFVLMESKYPEYPEFSEKNSSTTNNETMKRFRVGNICPACNGKLILSLEELKNSKEASMETQKQVKCPICREGNLAQKLLKQY